MKLKKDHWVGLLLVILGIAMLLLSMQIPVKNSSTDPGSRLFPVMASILQIVCGAGILISAGKSTDKQFLPAQGWKKLGMAFGVMIAYTLALKYIGFVVSTLVFLYVVVTMLAGEEKVAVWKKILYSVVVTGLAWLVFQRVLSMNLPTGILF